MEPMNKVRDRGTQWHSKKTLGLYKLRRRLTQCNKGVLCSDPAVCIHAALTRRDSLLLYAISECANTAIHPVPWKPNCEQGALSLAGSLDNSGGHLNGCEDVIVVRGRPLAGFPDRARFAAWRPSAHQSRPANPRAGRSCHLT
jgi:hypothetical protein